MALSPTYVGSTLNVVNSSNFIPKMWSDEVKREMDRTMTMKEAVEIKSHVGKKGDEIKFPLIRRMGVFDKLTNTPVVIQSFPDDVWNVRIDKFKEASFAVEDLLKIQSAYDNQSEYTREAGYAIGIDCDNAILALRASIPISQQIVVSSNNLISGDPLPINEASILAAIQGLNTANAPQKGRMLLVGVGQYTDMLNISKFISRDFVNGVPVESGIIGSLYGVPVMQTTQITPNTLDGFINGYAAVGQPTPGVAGSPYMPTQDAIVGLAAGLPRGKTGFEVAQPFITALLVQKGWAKFVPQREIRSETSRENVLQSDLVVSTHLYGCRVYRPDHCVLIHTAV